MHLQGTTAGSTTAIRYKYHRNGRGGGLMRFGLGCADAGRTSGQDRVAVANTSTAVSCCWTVVHATPKANYRQALSCSYGVHILYSCRQQQTERLAGRQIARLSRSELVLQIATCRRPAETAWRPCRFQSITAAKTPVFNQPMSLIGSCAGPGQGKSCEARLGAGDLNWRSPDTHNGLTWAAATRATRKPLR